ncbi:ATP-dependent nuclease [Heliorestis convoluta]|uniref:SMC N terminal domain protein n=1 Tax=Heliorestis convoluta TaxID=356322 RepID=A0A5Q2MZF3_9FIRM|nr:AAA family ATPase [Heliorestis convoluta]QGG46312.1 SMC N terminal domain protein [Heliorestis convoluta]
MYISQIEIFNFRSFQQNVIEFNEGMNVIIGHNNAGKTNLLSALGLIFNQNQRYRPDVEDFNKNIPICHYLTKNEKGIYIPPKITISVWIQESSEFSNELSDDNNVIYAWRIIVDRPYLAKLTYEFFLPEGAIFANYQKDIQKLVDEKKDIEIDFWDLLKRKYIRKYISRIYGGDEKLRNRANSEELSKFDYQFLDAIRDVEKKLLTGKNILLKEVLTYFLDYQLEGENDAELQDEREKRYENFREESGKLIKSLKERIHTEPILDYAKNVGASIEGIPNFEGRINEVELFSALSLIIEKETGIKIPVTHNGLGYNNLIYMSILLAKMQMQCTDYVNEDEQKVFPMLLIEEPEAHLHPAMQYKFLKFLKQKLKEKDKVRQIFITTHSTHITAAVDLDEIIILNIAQQQKLNVSYPGKVFDLDSEEDKKSKAYVKRFLDATKSDMLFAKSIIMVEGIAEQLLLSCFADYVKKEKHIPVSLEDNHVCVVNISGRYFNHFLKLFYYAEQDPLRKSAINKRISCITDTDPTKRKIEKKAKNTKCFPFELQSNPKEYTYKDESTVLFELKQKQKDHNNIRIFSQLKGKGKTFEYELAYWNPTCQLLLTDYVSNRNELESLMSLYLDGKDLDEMLTRVKSEKLISKIKAAPQTWEEKEKKKALIAARYLQSVESNKGEHALELAYQLRKNLEKGQPVSFRVPPYIEEAILWACGQEEG